MAKPKILFAVKLKRGVKTPRYGGLYSERIYSLASN